MHHSIIAINHQSGFALWPDPSSVILSRLSSSAKASLLAAAGLPHCCGCCTEMRRNQSAIISYKYTFSHGSPV